MPLPFAPIYLTLQLWDSDPSKTIKATVRKPDGSLVPGSPVTLTHAAGGFYVNSELKMPNVDFVSAFYEVFDDQGMTQKSVKHVEAFETFQREGDESGGIDTNLITAVLEDVFLDLVATCEQVMNLG